MLLFKYSILIISLLLFSCKGKKKDQSDKNITAFIAAGLTEPANEIIEAFSNSTEIKVKTNFASSGTLARQINQGEVPDIYISASMKWMKYTANNLEIKEDNINKIVKDVLVIITPINSNCENKSIEKLHRFYEIKAEKKISIGNPAHVPAGNYSKQALEYYDVYEKVSDNIITAKDVRSALRYVEMEEAFMGMVYNSVAIQSDKIKIIDTVDSKAHKPIVFSGIISKESDLANEFMDFIISEESEKIWEKYGFN